MSTLYLLWHLSLPNPNIFHISDLVKGQIKRNIKAQIFERSFPIILMTWRTELISNKTWSLHPDKLTKFSRKFLRLWTFWTFYITFKIFFLLKITVLYICLFFLCCVVSGQWEPAAILIWLVLGVISSHRCPQQSSSIIPHTRVKSDETTPGHHKNRWEAKYPDHYNARRSFPLSTCPLSNSFYNTRVAI